MRIERVSTKRRLFERMFAHMRKRVRYLDVAKNQFTSFMRAIYFNMKRLVILQDSYAFCRDLNEEIFKPSLLNINELADQKSYGSLVLLFW